MPTVIAHHDVKDTAHWLASTKRAEVQSPAFGEAMDLDGVLPETVVFLVES